MRSLRWVGLMSSLLFVGVLGGLLAPLPSEAATPTLAIKIDGATVVPSGNPVGGFLITSSTTCNASETTLGYTACYGIRTSTTAQYGGSSRKYTIQNAPNSTARLRTAEKKGQDKFSLVGIQFVPVASTWAGATALQYNNEAHEIIITTRKVFDGAVNVDNAQTYVYALRTGGEFRAGPTTAGACGTNTSDGLCDSIGDSITYTGTGTFGPHSSLQNRNILSPAGSSKNTQPLSFTVAGPHLDPILSYDGLTNTTMGQVDPTYPRFLCTSNADGVTIAPPANCRPTVNHIMTVKLKGQDTFVLVGGVDDFSADCTAQLSAQQERQLKFLASLVKVLDWWEDRHPNVRLRAFITRIELILDGANNNTDPTCPGATLVNLDMATAAAEDYRDFVEHGAVAAEPEPETGTITITKNLPHCVGGSDGGTGCKSQTFSFSIVGPTTTTLDVVTKSNGSDGSASVSVNPGTYSVSEDAKAGWILGDVVCDGGAPHDEFFVPPGGNVTCTFNNSPAGGTSMLRISTQVSLPDPPYPDRTLQ